MVFHYHINEKVINRVFHSLIIEKVKIKRRYPSDILLLFIGGVIMKLNLYSVSDKYIKYLRQFDNRVYDNKEEKRIHERKYVGIV